MSRRHAASQSLGENTCKGCLESSVHIRKCFSLRPKADHEESQYSVRYGLETNCASRCDSRAASRSLRALSFSKAFSAISVKPVLCSDKAPDRQAAKLHERHDHTRSKFGIRRSGYRGRRRAAAKHSPASLTCTVGLPDERSTEWLQFAQAG